MLIMEADKRKSLIEDINDILCKHDPIKGEVEIYRVLNLTSNLVNPTPDSVGFSSPYQYPARDISDQLDGFITIDALQLFIYKRMLEYEYTTDLEYVDYYLGGCTEEDRREFFSRVHERTFPGRAGRLEDYEDIAKEIFSLKVKHFVQV